MNVRTIILTMAAALLTACSSDTIPGNIEPKIVVYNATDVTRTEATLHGEVTLQGSTEMPELHFVYGEAATRTERAVAVSPEENRAELRLTGLVPGTEYSFSLRGSNGRTTIESQKLNFTTLPNDRPKLGRLRILSKGPVSVIAGFTITDDGNEAITKAGCYVTDTKTGLTDTAAAVQLTAGDSLYRVRIGNLKQDNTYLLQAYASNRSGETVGDTLKILTNDAVTLEKAGILDELMGDNKYECTKLSFEGPMNGDDLRCLRQMMGRDADGSATPGQLSDIDMTDCRIVEGGGVYGASRFTKNDVVGYGLFADCDRLLNVNLPSSTITIEKDAFANCTVLKTITIPALTASISPSAGCTALENIYVSAANINYCSIDGVLFNTDITQILWFPFGKKGDYTLPATVTAIGDYAFQGCSVTHFTLPDGLTEIGQAVFYDSKVQEVDMPDNLRLIPTATFQKCSELTTVRLGAKTELISDYVFDGCPLQHLYITAQYPPVCNSNALTNTAYNMTATCTLHVPKGRRNFYRADSNWGKFKNIVETE